MGKYIFLVTYVKEKDFHHQIPNFVNHLSLVEKEQNWLKILGLDILFKP